MFGRIEKKENQKKEKIGGIKIRRTPKKRKYWRELNLADFHQIRQIRQIFFPQKFLPRRYVTFSQKYNNISNKIWNTKYVALIWPETM